MARNQLIEIATASLSDLMKEHPEHRAEAKQDLQLLNAQKMGEQDVYKRQGAKQGDIRIGGTGITLLKILVSFNQFCR